MASDYAQTIPWLLDNVGKAVNFSASATQTQGQGEIAVGFTRVNVVGTANDVITLPPAVSGIACVVHNTDAGQVLQVYPNTDDAIDGLGANNSVVIHPQQIVWFWAVDSINWASYGRSVRGAASYTASATQTQAGGTPITTEIANVNVVATDNNACTLFSAFFGAKCDLKNTDAGQDMLLFPASGNKFDGYATDEGVVIGANSSVSLRAVTNAQWSLTHNVTTAKGTFAASATQTQAGGTSLTQGYTRISVVGTDGDAVTLPLAYKGMVCTLDNTDSANYAQVFPAVSDAIDDAAADLPILIWPGQRIVLNAVDGTTWRTDWKSRARSLQTGITAFATGGQASATLLIADDNVVSTVATAGDSVKLPAGDSSLRVWVYNDTANAFDLFPNTSNSINSLPLNTAISIAPGSGVTLRSISATVWKTF